MLILGLKRRDLSQNFHHWWLKSWGVVMVVGDEFQSQPCLTIQYTNGERLEGLRCCELPESVSTHSIWVQKVGVWAMPNLYPLATRKQVVVAILEPIYQSEPCITIHYTYNERLDGLSWYEMAEWVCTRSNLVWKLGAWSLNLNCHHPRLKSWGVVMVVEGEF